MQKQAFQNLYKKCLLTAVIFALLSVCTDFIINTEAQAHGGKTHGESDFAALQALQKATELYDRLIVSGKLDESWETGLAKVEVLSRMNQDAMEYRVGFHRRSGNPEAVYIFLSSEGKYTGSNFDGNW